ncbi:MAG TPA: anti-sigma factor [Nocardioidaceae bacterium]|nr:anti-sigma factor [Nocardioidaceae bacterium]
MSTDLHTLSGAYAINALSPEEADEFSTHLEECTACRDEVRELQDAAARMGASEAVAPPTALRARVLTAADRLPQLPPHVTPIRRARSRRWTTRVVGAVAAAVIAVTGIGVAVNQLRDPAEPSQSVAGVFDAPDAASRTMTTANGGKLRVAMSATYGQMAVATQGLPELRGRTYQMWAIRNGRPSSVGLVEDLSKGKVMPIPAPGTTVAITIEPAGGSTQPTTQPIIAMDPEAI